MSIPWAIGIVILVLGIIVGNLLLLKHSANLSMKGKNTPDKKPQKQKPYSDDEDEDFW